MSLTLVSNFLNAAVSWAVIGKHPLFLSYFWVWWHNFFSSYGSIASHTVSNFGICKFCGTGTGLGFNSMHIFILLSFNVLISWNGLCVFSFFLLLCKTLTSFWKRSIKDLPSLLQTGLCCTDLFDTEHSFWIYYTHNQQGYVSPSSFLKTKLPDYFIVLFYFFLSFFF